MSGRRNQIFAITILLVAVTSYARSSAFLKVYGSRPDDAADAQVIGAFLAGTDGENVTVKDFLPAAAIGPMIENNVAEEKNTVESVAAGTAPTTPDAAPKALVAQHSAKAEAAHAGSTEEGGYDGANAEAEDVEGSEDETEADGVETNEGETSEEDGGIDAAQDKDDEAADNSESNEEDDATAEADDGEQESHMSLLQTRESDDEEAEEVEAEEGETTEEEAEEGEVAEEADEGSTDDADADEENSDDVAVEMDDTALEDFEDSGAQDAAAAEAEASGEVNEETLVEDAEEEQDETESSDAEDA